VWQTYSGINYPIAYWQTASGLEVDFVLGDHEVAIEIKATAQANNRHLKGLNSFAEEYTVRNLLLKMQKSFLKLLNGL